MNARAVEHDGDWEALEADQQHDEEHFHLLEKTHELCVHATPTGDKRWPILCARDMRYSGVKFCRACPRRNPG
jgi:hypothetical protein